MIVVSDTSPITNLAAINQLDLLRVLFDDVAIPQAVAHELLAAGPGRSGFVDTRAVPWITIRPVQDRALVQSLFLDLDIGEAEAIALGIELRCDVLLVDERRGRHIAQRLGLRTLGLLGMLVKAKNDSVLPAVRPILDELIIRAGFWITTELYNRVLSEVSEIPK